jgi:NhaA family Na+:H+ antiporter
MNSRLASEIVSLNGIGIITGLFFGKVAGISGAVLISRKLRITEIPSEWKLSHIIGAGFLGGIGFTMSIFISILAFGGNTEFSDSSKAAILTGSALSGLCGYAILKISSVRRQK